MTPIVTNIAVGIICTCIGVFIKGTYDYFSGGNSQVQIREIVKDEIKSQHKTCEQIFKRIDGDLHEGNKRFVDIGIQMAKMIEKLDKYNNSIMQQFQSHEGRISKLEGKG